MVGHVSMAARRIYTCFFFQSLNIPVSHEKKKMLKFLPTRRLKAIPWDAWAMERSTGMNCEVSKVSRLIS